MKIFSLAPSQYSKKIAACGSMFFTILSVLVLLGSQQAAAISQNDIDCANESTCFYDPDASGVGVCGTDTSTTLTGSSPEQKIFNYYVSKGLSAMDAAAIDGNYGQESGWNSSDTGGYLAQWGSGRLTALETFAQKENQPVTDLGVQLDYSWLELTNGPGAGSDMTAVLAHLKAATNIKDAVDQFMGPDPDPQPGYPQEVSGGYEDPGIPQEQNRLNYAQTALTLYGGSTGNSGTTPPNSSGCDETVNCSDTTANTAGLSQTRQNVVCIAQQELALWKSQPAYATADFPYAAKGYLKYSQGIYEEWCADFVSWVYNQAKDPLQPDPNWGIASVLSVQAVPASNNSFHYHSDGSGYVPKPGDLAIHQGPGVSHVNIFISASGGVSTYIGGDQGNYRPFGADSPTTIPPDPPSESIVSIELGNGYYDNDIVGYVSPD